MPLAETRATQGGGSVPPKTRAPLLEWGGGDSEGTEVFRQERVRPGNGGGRTDVEGGGPSKIL